MTREGIVTTVWLWERVSFDFLDTSDGEGWAESLNFGIAGGLSIERVICRLGSVGSGVASFTDADLGVPGMLIELAVFAQLPDEQRQYFHGAHAAVTNVNRWTTAGQQTNRMNFVHSVPAFDVDVTARLRVPDSATGYGVGIGITCVPVPQQDNQDYLYRAQWRTVGQLSYLLSGVP